MIWNSDVIGMRNLNAFLLFGVCTTSSRGFRKGKRATRNAEFGSTVDARRVTLRARLSSLLCTLFTFIGVFRRLARCGVNYLVFMTPMMEFCENKFYAIAKSVNKRSKTACILISVLVRTSRSLRDQLLNGCCFFLATFSKWTWEVNRTSAGTIAIR